MSYTLDIESFIEEVHKESDLWDTRLHGFRIQSKKSLAWANVARVFIEDFDEMNPRERDEVYRKLNNKWRNIRDSYVRHRKNKFGKRGYLYAPKLTFLDPLYDTKNEEEQLNESQDWNESGDSKKIDILMRKNGKQRSPEAEYLTEDVWDAEEDELTSRSLRQENMKRKNIEYVETLMPDPSCSSSGYPIEDEDRAFFDSLLPAVRDFDIDQKLEFRSGVLKMVKLIRGTKKRIKIDPDDDDEY